MWRIRYPLGYQKLRVTRILHTIWSGPGLAGRPRVSPGLLRRMFPNQHSSQPSAGIPAVKALEARLG